MSVVSTVLNDREGLAELLAALAAQEHPADEILIVDGGSCDGSVAIATYWAGRGLPVRVIDLPGAGISRGRNAGIAAASHERVAITDAGCRPEPGWLAAFAEALECAEFVCGTYAVDHVTPLEHAVAVSLYPDVTEIGTSSRVVRAWHAVFGRAFAVHAATGRSMAFTRRAWAAGGGFPELVDAGEDVAFSAAVCDTGVPVALAPAARVAWRGRPNWRKNWSMYYRYGRGDGLLGRRLRAIERVSGATALLLLTSHHRTRPLAGLLLGCYLWLPAVRARRTGLGVRHWWRIPIALALKDIAMVGGTAAGQARRATDRAPSTGAGTVTRTPVRSSGHQGVPDAV